MSREEKLGRQKEFLIKFAYWAIQGSAVVLLVKYAGPVLLPFIAAFFIAWLLAGPVRFLEQKTHLKRNLAAVFVVALFYGLLCAFLYFAGFHIVRLVRDLFSEVTAFVSGTLLPVIGRFAAWVAGLSADLAAQYAASREAAYGSVAEEAAAIVGSYATAGGGPVQYTPGGSVAPDSRAVQMLSDVSGTLLNSVSDAAAEIPGFFMNIIFTVIATLFMELEFPSIQAFLGRQIPEKWRKTVTDGKAYVMGTLGKCLLSYGLILVMTFAELFAGFLILGVDGAFVIAFLIAVMDILPVLGTGTVLIPWTVIAFASSNIRMGAGILALYLIITVVRNIVEPRLVGRQMGLSPVVMLPCMLLGLKFFGIAGLFGMPFGVSFLKSLNDRGIIHIFNSGQEQGI